MSLLEEARDLLADATAVYEDIPRKLDVLDRYARRCIHNISGRTIDVSLNDLANGLEKKADWLMEHIRAQEWIRDEKDGGWFNSYYDNHRRPLEGIGPDSVRMMLTGQVFAVMSGTATDEQVRAIMSASGIILASLKNADWRTVDVLLPRPIFLAISTPLMI